MRKQIEYWNWSAAVVEDSNNIRYEGVEELIPRNMVKWKTCQQSTDTKPLWD